MAKREATRYRAPVTWRFGLRPPSTPDAARAREAPPAAPVSSPPAAPVSSPPTSAPATSSIGPTTPLPRAHAREPSRPSLWDTHLGPAVKAVVMGAGLVGGALPASAETVQLAEQLLFGTPTPATVAELSAAYAKSQGEFGLFSETLYRTQLRPVLERLPRGATPEARWVLEKLATDGTIAAPVYDDMVRLLRDKGLVVRSSPYGRISTDDLPQLLARASGATPPTAERVRTLFAGEPVSEARWHAKILPELWRLPLTASDQARALLDVYADPAVVLAEGVAPELGQLLRAHGYDVPTDHRPSAAEAARIRADAVHEVDPVFARLAHAVGRESAIVSIAVIDGGLDVGHPALAGKLAVNTGEIPGNRRDDDKNGKVDDVHGYNFADDKGDLDRGTVHSADYTGHGTNVVGLATRGTDRVKAVAIAVDGPTIGAQLDYALSRGAKVVNLSFELSRPADRAALRAQIEAHPDVLFVLSARNDGVDLATDAPAKRALYEPRANLMVLTSADDHGAPVPGTNWGAPWVTHAARSTILSPSSDHTYVKAGMTSMATPHATNVAAKCLILDPALEPGQLSRILAATSTPSEVWATRVAAGGVVSDEAALTTAALTRALRTGSSPEAAAERVGVPASSPWLALARALVSGS